MKLMQNQLRKIIQKTWVVVFLISPMFLTAQTSITITPANRNFDFPLDVATGWPAQVTNTFQVAIQALTDVNLQLSGTSGIPSSAFRLTDGSGNVVNYGPGVAAGNYTLSIVANDPGVVVNNPDGSAPPLATWGGTLTVTSGGRRPQSDSASMTGIIGRDLGPNAPTTPPTTPPTPPTTPPTPPTPPTTPTPPPTPPPPTGGNPTLPPPNSVIPTPWSGGTARLSARDNHRILMDGKPLGVARRTRGPQTEKVIYDLNGAVNARLMLRKNRQLTLSFAPIASKLNGRGTKLTSHQSDRTPGTVIVGLTRPTKSQYRAYQSGFVQRAAHSFVSGRVQR